MKKTVQLILGTLVCASYLQVGAHEVGKQKKRPNLLVIHTDEQSFRSLSCYENSWSEIQTPYIDKLAEGGVKFENFFANHPVCTPSRATLLTGKYAFQVDSYFNDIPLADDAVTFAHILRDQGYTTGYSGKLHLDGDGKPAFQPDRDFGFSDHRFMYNRGHWKKITEDEGKPKTYSYKEIGDEESYTTDYLTKKTINFINDNKEEEWCYMLCFPDPHGPDTERSPYDSMYDPDKMQVPESFNLSENDKPNWAFSVMSYPRNEKEIKKFQQTKAVYLGMVKHIDDSVGRLFAELKKTGQLENTVIVYTADHGDLMGEYGRYNKGVPLDGSAKIPFIVYYPEQIKEGLVVHEVASNMDFLPSVLDLLNVEYNSKKFEGQSFLPLLEGSKNAKWENTSFMSSSNWVATVSNEYKLVYSLNEKPWLYDRKNDPEELKNFFNEESYKSIVKELSLELKSYLKDSGDPHWNNDLEKFIKLRYGKNHDKKVTDTSKLKNEILKYADSN